MSDPADRTGAQLVLDILTDEGVDVVFGYPGGAIMPLYDAIYAHPIEHVLTRHEAAAAFAAGGYARSSGRVGVCLATSGPGATNLVTGVLDAQMDSVPLVAITGQVRTALMGTDGFQEADVTSIMGPVTKRSVCVRDVRDLERTLRAAFRLARGPRPGPVLVDIPTDVLRARCSKLDPFAVPPVGAPADRADPSAIERAIALLRAARKPVAIAGGGVRSADATAAFRAFCALTGVPHCTTINALGAAEPGDPASLGMLGMHGWKAANLAVHEADLVFGFGVRFDDRVTGNPQKFAPHATIVHADVDASELGKIVPVEVALRGDLRATLESLVLAIGPEAPDFSAWAREAKAVGGPLPADRAPGGALSATDVIAAFMHAMPSDAIVVTDVGQHQMWAAQRQRASDPRNFVTSAGLGSMGFGLPAAIGAKFANPGREVVAICGDGGFQMHLPELATLRRYATPVKILLIDNQRLGMVRQWQELFWDGRYAHTDLSDNPDFVAVARAYGVRAERVEDAGEVRDALERFIAADEPMLLHCACYAHENVWPLIPPGATALDAMEGRAEALSA